MKRSVRLGVVALAVLGATFVATAPAKADLVVNGGFETGDFTGWTLSGNTDDTYVVSNPVNSGFYAAGLSNDTTYGYLSQYIPTVANQQYVLSYWLYSDGYTPNEFSASIGSTTLFSQSNIPYQPYTEYTFVFTATSASSNLVFGFEDFPGYLYLDDVSINSVPEPSTAVSSGLGALILIGYFYRRDRKGKDV